MNKSSYVNPKFDLNLEKPSGNLVSYSQFAQFSKCPLAWKLSYIDKLKTRESTIHTIFGDAMHNVIQQWIKVMYTESIKKSNEMDLRGMLLNEMREQYAHAVETTGQQFSTKEELTEFYMDGAETLMWLKRRRKKFFDPSNEILIGTEVPLVIKIDGITFVAYLDCVRKQNPKPIKQKTALNHGREYVPPPVKILIDDFKTSGKGWNDWTKKDDTKTAQLILYKIFFAQQYDVPIDEIDVEFVILKRKIREDMEYPDRRVQKFAPSHGKISCNKVRKKFDAFLKSCFLPDGSFNTMYEYKACSGSNLNNCKFCEFNVRFDLCPLESRLQFISN